MTPTIRDVLFIDGVRTPFGRATDRGLYAHTRSDDLIASCLRDLLRRNPRLPADRIDEVAIAATTQVGDQGLNLGRMASLLAGLPNSVPGFTINRMCAGALTAVTTTAAGIAAGQYDLTLAGGVEHMGRHPMGHNSELNPRLDREQLVDPSALSMGATAENLHDQLPQLTRDRAERYALASQAKAAAARETLARDLTPIAIRDPQQGWGLATADELPRPDSTPEQLAALRPAFRPHGRVTAATSAPRTDGAGACLLAAADTATDLGLKPRLRLVSYAYAGVAPEIMGTGPIPATEKALRKAGLSFSELGLIEINEAFAVQVLAFLDHFGLDDEDPRVNPAGGALALGHPLAASGVRLLTQLAGHFAAAPQVRYGLTVMCVGLGMGAALIWENPHHLEYSRPTGDPRSGVTA